MTNASENRFHDDIWQHKFLKEDTSTAKALGAGTAEVTDGVSLSEGWALKTTKKSARFNEAQKKCLKDKFNLGQQTGHKQDPERVAKDNYAFCKESRWVAAVLRQRVPLRTTDTVMLFKNGI